MKIVVQLVSKVDGTRTPTFSGTRSEVARLLKSHFPVDDDDCYVLVLCDDAVSAAWEFSTAPMMSIKRFVEDFNHG